MDEQRNNPGVAGGYRRANKNDISQKARDRYNSAHWGIDGKNVFHIDEDNLPDELVQMGKLEEIVCEVDGDDDDDLEFKFPVRSGCRLAYTHDEAERMYCLLPKVMKQAVAGAVWQKGAPSYSLTQVAKQAGGRQADYPYPAVKVQPIGRCIHLVYKTNKKGDGLSSYIHQLGEESGILPILCVSQDGRLWFAGGNYTVPDAGITD